MFLRSFRTASHEKEATPFLSRLRALRGWQVFGRAAAARRLGHRRRVGAGGGELSPGHLRGLELREQPAVGGGLKARRGEGAGQLAGAFRPLEKWKGSGGEGIEMRGKGHEKPIRGSSCL